MILHVGHVLSMLAALTGRQSPSCEMIAYLCRTCTSQLVLAKCDKRWGNPTQIAIVMKPFFLSDFLWE